MSGTIETVELPVWTTLQKTTFGDYREFGGFQFPTRQVWQTPWGMGEARFDSFEMNTVERSAFELPKELHRQSDSQATGDR